MSLYVCDGVDHLHCGREASPATIISAVRAGVESGTIKGEVQPTSILNVSDVPVRVLTVDGPSGLYLVIPVSDGGSETRATVDHRKGTNEQVR